MEKTSVKNEKLLLALGAVGAGFLSGLLGAGGGIILYFVLGALYGKGAKQNLILSSVSVMFFCVVSLFFYKGNSALNLEGILRVGIPAALGGLAGATLLSKIPAAVVKKMFSVIIILSGIIMLMR
ncbi:MAG: TSUP family transporter [Clostridia bacterium]|nr:TSUP family transporter [Clostridia bacterium]